MIDLPYGDHTSGSQISKFQFRYISLFDGCVLEDVRLSQRYVFANLQFVFGETVDEFRIFFEIVRSIERLARATKKIVERKAPDRFCVFASVCGCMCACACVRECVVE